MHGLSQAAACVVASALVAAVFVLSLCILLLQISAYDDVKHMMRRGTKT
jgi:hypothetical protein